MQTVIITAIICITLCYIVTITNAKEDNKDKKKQE